MERIPLTPYPPSLKIEKNGKGNRKILELNKFIAEFMGIKIVKRNNEDAVYCFENAAYPEYFRCTKHNTYNSDWNMLMPVIKKIQSLGYRVNIHFWPEYIDRESGCEIACMIYDDIQHVNPAHWGENVLECTYSCVVEFVKSIPSKSVSDMSSSDLSTIDTFQNKNRGFKEDERERFRNY